MPTSATPPLHKLRSGATPSSVKAKRDADNLPRIDIPVRDPDPENEACETLFRRGRFLARQEAWDKLGMEICTSDAERRMTPGLTPAAYWLAVGARRDAVAAARDALSRNDTRAVHAAIAALEINQVELPDCPALAYVVTMAHIDLAAAWRGNRPLSKLPPAQRESHDRHMRVAMDLVDRHDPLEFNSGLWAFARCAVLAADPRATQRVADDYEDLIDLDPGCILHPMALGRDLTPQRFGSYEALDVQARRTASRTGDVWGDGAYTLVYMGALQTDPGAVLRLDAELFVAGLHDLLTLHPQQSMVNRMAAFCGVTLAGRNVPGSARARISDCFNWIVEDYLTELHPAIWASAAPTATAPLATEDRDKVRRGMSRAISTLSERYSHRIADGERLIFTPSGLTFSHSA